MARYAASLTFYTVLSLAPTFIIVVSIASSAVGEPAARAALTGFIESRLGPEGAAVVVRIGEEARSEASGPVTVAIGIVTLLLGSTIVFSEIHAGLNSIWRAESREGLAGLLWGRLVAFLMVLGLGVLLLASVVASTILGMASSVVEDLTGGTAALAPWGEHALSFVLVTLAFALVFKFVPDAQVSWRHVWAGALITAVLFNVGKVLIGTYLATQAFQSVYGAAASFVAFLFWTYYSAHVFFFGAGWTHVFAERYRSRPRQASK
jgi:membrane protein